MSTRKLYLIGTKHKYQYGAGAQANKFNLNVVCTEIEENAFREYVRSAAQKFDVKVIAEELNRQGLDESAVQHSVLEALARTLNIAHRFCEPNLDERRLLDIEESETAISDLAFMKNLIEPAKELLIRFWFLKREMVWLQRLLGLDQWPVLFICGCDHVQSFQQLIATQKISCELVCDKWDFTQ